MTTNGHEQDDSPRQFRVLLRLWRFLRPHLWRGALVLVLLLAGVAVQLGIPRAFGGGIDAVRGLEAIGAADRTAYWRREILWWALLFGGLVLGSAALRFSQGLAQVSYQQHVLTDLRCAIFDAVQHLSLNYHISTTTGELISRGTRDVDRLRRFLSDALFSTFSLVVYTVGMIALMVSRHPVLPLVALCPLPASVYLLIRFARRLRPMWRAVSDAYGQVTTVLQENIAGARVVKAFGRERDEVGKFERTAADYLAGTIQATSYWAGRMPLAQAVFGLSMPLLLAGGGYLVGRGQMTVGDLVAFMGYLMLLAFRIRAIGRLVNIFQEAAASGERIFAVLDQEPTVADRAGVGPLPEGAGRVEFRDVSFEHDSGTLALREVTFTAEPGQMVAVVGRTGSGKSTLVSLIPRFHDPTTGQVLLDGVDVRDIRLRDLRRAVGFIFQDTFLFSATVAENIADGVPEATPEQVRRCAQAAQADEFVAQLPDGYDTVIGERGVTLSGGQRQRLAIARAFLTNPRILIMDDATASVDSTTERMIHESMLDLARGRTTFIIAHRLSTVRRADLILVLDDGRIIERGTHADLLALNGAYRQLFETQLDHGADDHGAARL